MTGLVDFVLARIAEDEAGWRSEGPCDCDIAGLPFEHGYRCPVPRLADCRAKRGILKLHAPEGATVRLLAAVYIDHDQFDPSWHAAADFPSAVALPEPTKEQK